MSVIINIPESERKIADMRDLIGDIKKTYCTLCESAHSEAPGWRADSRECFEKTMGEFREQCETLSGRAEILFDAQEEYFKRLKAAEEAFNNG